MPSLIDVYKGLTGGVSKVGGAFMGHSTGADIRRYDKEDQLRQLEIRGQQQGYAQLLKAQAEGRGPSLFAPALAQAQRAGTAVAASARGANMGLAGRTAAQTTARLGMSAAELRAKEQLMAQQTYMNALNEQRKADLIARQQGVALGAAQLQSETATAEGNAARGQKGAGAAMALIGGLASDPVVKDNVTPIGGPAQGFTNAGQVLGGYQANVQFQQPMAGTAGVGLDPSFSSGAQQTSYGSQQTVEAARATAAPGQAPPQGAPYQQPGYAPTQSVEAYKALANWQQKEMAAMEAQKRTGLTKDPYQIDLELAQGLSGSSVGTPSTTAPAAAKEEGGIGGGLQMAGQILSDPVTKNGLQPAQQTGALAAAAARTQPIAFSYKPEAAAAEGVSTQPRIGVPANRMPGSLAENPVYAPTVQMGLDGVARVNTDQATMANIAVTSDIARKQQEDAGRLEALERAVMKTAGGQGARGRSVVASDVLGGQRPAPNNSPPPGAVPTGQRYRALDEAGGTVPAAYGRDLTGSLQTNPDDAPPPRGVMGRAIRESGEAAARGIKARRHFTPAEQARTGPGSDADVGLMDRTLHDREQLAALKGASDSAAGPQEQGAYKKALREMAPTVHPGSAADKNFRQEFRGVSGALNESQMGGIAHSLAQSKPAPSTQGFKGAGAQRTEAVRAKKIRDFFQMASEAAEVEAEALGAPSPRLRPKDVEALLKARGVKLRKGEAASALRATDSGQPTYDM